MVGFFVTDSCQVASVEDNEQKQKFLMISAARCKREFISPYLRHSARYNSFKACECRRICGAYIYTIFRACFDRHIEISFNKVSEFQHLKFSAHFLSMLARKPTQALNSNFVWAFSVFCSLHFMKICALDRTVTLIEIDYYAGPFREIT